MTADALMDEAIREITSKAASIVNNLPRQRCFIDVPETFNRSATGNRELNDICGFCDYKVECWPGVEHLPTLPSEAKNPRFKYYTYVAEKWRKK